MKKIFRKTIRGRIFFPMLLFLLMQTAALLVVFLGGGIVSQVKSNAYDSFSQIVETRKNYVQDTLVTRWSNLESVMRDINGDIELLKSLTGEKAGSEKIFGIQSTKNDRFLEAVYPALIDLIKVNNVTGAFIVIEPSSDTTSLDGLYLRCETPSNISPETLYMNVASPYMRLHALAGVASSPAKSELTFDFSNRTSDLDYYFEPYEAALEDEALEAHDWENYAFWAQPHSVVTGSRVLSYSVPLIYNGDVYGVLGVDISVSVIEKLLPYREISGDNSGAYVITSTPTEDSFHSLVRSGTDYNHLFGDASHITLKETKVVDLASARETKSKLTHDKVYAIVTPFKLNNNNSHFSNNIWYLVGLQTSGSLFFFANAITSTVLLLTAISDAIGMIMIILVSKYISRPVTTLPQKMRALETAPSGKLERTGVYEIDTIIDSIEELSIAVMNNASKLSKIIELSNVPLGAFEVDKINNTLEFTDKLCLVTGAKFKMGVSTAIDFIDFINTLENSRIATNDGARLYNFITESGEPRWITIRSSETREHIIGIAQDVTEERLDRNRIEHERDYDLLTGLLNRRAFQLRAHKLFEQPQDLKFGAVIMIDMDNLKIVNDTFGHEQGDEYLRAMAKILKAFIPNENLIVSRQSGDEFIALFYGYNNKDLAQTEIKALQKSIDNSVIIMPTSQKIKLRCSGGIAYYPSDAVGLDDLLRYADYAMYEIKQGGKGDFNTFNLERYNKRQYRNENYEKLNNLIEKELVEYKFQPIVSLKSGRVYAYEALMRPIDKSFSSPQEIITLARAQHKLGAIERITWFKALEYFEKFADIVGQRHLFINSIPNEVLPPEEIEFLGAKYKNILERVVIEFTEDEKVNEETADYKKSVVKKWGGKVAIDDFGMGYSSDNILLMLNPHYIKVDMFIIRDVDTNPSKRKLLKNIVDYARERKVKVIAEGVETRSELEAVIACKVDFVQGYYTAMPDFIPGDTSEEIKDEILSINARLALKPRQDKPADQIFAQDVAPTTIEPYEIKLMPGLNKTDSTDEEK